MWGDVHFSLDETLEAEVTANKTSQETIYAEGIIPDLEFAVANLPATQSQYGRATKPAAEFLLGQALLTRGYQTFGSANDFVQAEALFSSVIANYTFALVPSHAVLWNQDNQLNSEIIWAIQYSTDLILNGGTANLPGYNFTAAGNRGHLYFGMEYDIQPGMIRDIAERTAIQTLQTYRVHGGSVGGGTTK